MVGASGVNSTEILGVHHNQILEVNCNEKSMNCRLDMVENNYFGKDDFQLIATFCQVLQVVSLLSSIYQLCENTSIGKKYLPRLFSKQLGFQIPQLN